MATAPPSDPAPSDAASVSEHPAVRRVVAALAGHGVPTTVRVLPDSARTAADAAAQLGIDVGQIANSLVFAVEPATAGGVVLVLTSGRHRVDTHRVARLVGAETVRRADAGTVRDATGFAIGGVAPVGHTRPLPTVVDAALGDYEQVWAAAGHPRAVFPTTATSLATMTQGTVAVVSAAG